MELYSHAGSDFETETGRRHGPRGPGAYARLVPGGRETNAWEKVQTPAAKEPRTLRRPEMACLDQTGGPRKTTEASSTSGPPRSVSKRRTLEPGPRLEPGEVGGHRWHGERPTLADYERQPGPSTLLQRAYVSLNRYKACSKKWQRKRPEVEEGDSGRNTEHP